MSDETKIDTSPAVITAVMEGVARSVGPDGWIAAACDLVSALATENAELRAENKRLKEELGCASAWIPDCQDF